MCSRSPSRPPSGGARGRRRSTSVRRLEAHALEGRHVDGAAIDAMLRDLRGAVDALRAERRLDETERLALAARLADAERDRSVHAERTAILERELERQAAVLGD